jgi:hypothetical protein
MRSPTLAAAAAMYARAGWPVFPIRPREKRPLTAHGLKDATCDADQVEAWWRAEPRANVAIRTGTAPDGAGLVVLDVDGPEGEAALTALGELVQTLEQRTGSGVGRQLLYALAPDQRGLQSAKRLGPGLDTRGEGGYVLLPPSVHPSGGLYAWSRLVDPAPPPDFLIDRPREVRLPARRAGGWTSDAPADLLRLCRFIAGRAPGARNDGLNWAAYRAGQLVGAGAIDRVTAEQELARAAAAAFGGEALAGEIENTIRSGLNAGIAEAPPVADPVAGVWERRWRTWRA